jgi:hypothetical protein
MMHGGNQVRAHLEDEDRQREDGGNGQSPPQPPCLALTTLGVMIACTPRIGGQAAGLVTRLFDRCFKVGRGNDPGKVAHPRALCRQVDVGVEHTRDLSERLLDPAHARRTGHVLDRELGGFFPHGVAGTLDGADRRLRIDQANEGEVGTFGGEIDRGCLDVRDGFQRALDAADARGTGHALDRQAQTGGDALRWIEDRVDGSGGHGTSSSARTWYQA